MASSLFVNTLQVDFTSVLTMEHAGMVRMFKTLEDTRLRGFLEGTTPVFESAVVEYFSNSRVLAGTIVSAVCGQKLVVMEDIFSGTFKLPTEGVQNFSGIPTETIAEMRIRFSATTVPFQSSGKKRDLLFEYRLLHDIVAKSLCAKAGSFDKVTCEKFEFMIAISAAISVNWGRILFQRLLAMVQTPRKQSQGFTVQVSMLMELLVRADLGTTTKLHVKKVLTSKKVQNYLKGNQGTTPTEETASNTTDGTSQQVPPEAAIPDITADIPAENRGIVVSTNDDPEEESETNSCPLVPRQRRVTQVSESSNSLPLTHLLKRLRTQKPDQKILPDPIPARTTAPAESPQGGNIDNLTENLDLNDQTEQGASLFTDTILTSSNTNEENIADNEQFAHGSKEPETIAPTPAAQIHFVVPDFTMVLCDVVLALALFPAFSALVFIFHRDCGRNRQSGPRPETRLLLQPALEGLTRSARTDSPRRVGRKQFFWRRRAAAEAARGGGGCGGLREERGRRFLVLGLG
ncbi:hypothetical protein F511_19828 [Dorcoceras hygrometricum]|uniref:Dystroglycan-like n=1 Tax=Dorcoceras hygrometricum TaxID=472368 RepID=A0A2Z7B414_9LAMI|nr:hypothetical protein F511_19828 [Dorcoceras hygrometricum]